VSSGFQDPRYLGDTLNSVCFDYAKKVPANNACACKRRRARSRRVVPDVACGGFHSTPLLHPGRINWRVTVHASRLTRPFELDCGTGWTSGKCFFTVSELWSNKLLAQSSAETADTSTTYSYALRWFPRRHYSPADCALRVTRETPGTVVPSTCACALPNNIVQDQSCFHHYM
jgi:hypothetical protein